MRVDRLIRGAWTGALSLSLMGVSLPITTRTASADVLASSALPPLFFKKKPRSGGGKGREHRPEITVSAAASQRSAAKRAVKDDEESEDWDAVADRLERSGKNFGDPILLLDAGEARLKQAKEDNSAEQAERSIETTRMGLDIAHFYAAVEAGDADTGWMVIRPSEADDLVTRGDEQVDEAKALIEELESGGDEPEEVVEEEDPGIVEEVLAEEEEPEPVFDEEPEPEEKPPGKGTGLIVGGSIATVVGIGGAAVGLAGIAISNRKQRDVEAARDELPYDPEKVSDLDREGSRANTMGYVGLAIGVVGLAVGIPLLAVGVKRRKASGAPADEEARLRIAPSFGRHQNGLVLSGRF